MIITRRIDCPLCDWHLDAEAPGVDPGALASVFGYGVMAAVADARHLEETERALRDHLETHPLAEWARKVTELKAPPALLPAEDMTLAVAREQVKRGDNPPINTTSMLVMALDRLTGREDWTAGGGAGG